MSAERDALFAVGDLLAVVVRRLQDVLPAIGQVSAAVGRDWSDEHGRAWAERAALVRRVLVLELDAAIGTSRLVADAVRDAVESDAARLPAAAPTPGPGRSGGPRLGGTSAERVDDQRGVRIAQLADEAPQPG